MKKNITSHKTIPRENQSRQMASNSFAIITKKPTEIYKILKEIISMRSTASMIANSSSSRGHLIITFIVENEDDSGITVKGKLVVIDMAGNEDYSISTRHDETKIINQHNSTAMNLIRSFAMQTKDIEPNNVFTCTFRKILKETSVVTVLTHLRHSDGAMRSQKFWLHQISSLITAKKNEGLRGDFVRTLERDGRTSDYQEGNDIVVSYGSDWFKANIITKITNNKINYLYIHYGKWSSTWDEWISEERVKD